MPSIDPERWRLLSRYLDEALELVPSQRSAWLATIRARDEALGSELASMLEEHDAVRRERFLDRAVLDPAAVTARASLAGHIVGAYRLTSLIGQGGTGSVWLAERSDGRFEGRAAVKLLNLSLLGRSGEERFRREGTILARLRHPHIAQLADAGVSPGGQPYLVLEHVDGEPIDLHCESRGLTVGSRLRLFLAVLDAVAHAHANLIVHRDIKPANVLVNRDGQVKLLDFGIAKLVEPDAGMDAVTRDGRALTPEYAAPEQLSGGAVTTATDVYALGVLLYVLLTGQHPAGRALDSPATLVRAIVETSPLRPSDTVNGRLQRTIRGDLDTIVSKALKKDAAERYPSVTAMADDIRRHLRHEPISARPDTLRYRATSFVRRHPRGVAASVAAFVVIAGLTVVYTVSLANERDRARREAAKAVTVSELMMSLLTSADPYASRSTGAEPTVRDLLDRGAMQSVSALSGEPDLQAEMLTMMGRTYRKLGNYDKALELLERALASGQQAFGAEHERVAETLHDLGVLYGERGDYAAAGRSLEQALGMRRRVLGPEHADVAATLAELGRVYQDQGFNERAEPVHREALDLRRRVLGDNHREVPVSISDVASVLRLKGDIEASESLLRHCLVLNRQLRGENHPNTITTLHDLALIAATRGDYEAAERGFRDAIPRQREALGDRHPVIAMMLNNLSHTLAHQSRYDEAASALDEALDLARSALGPAHQLVAIYSINRAAIDLARGRPERAEPLLREALSIRGLAPGLVPSRRRTLQEHDWAIASVKRMLGDALLAQRRFAEAEGLLLEVYGQLESAADASGGELTVTRARLEALYRAWRKPDLAARYQSAGK